MKGNSGLVNQINKKFDKMRKKRLIQPPHTPQPAGNVKERESGATMNS